MKITCPFCGNEAYVIDDLISICAGCFKRWETTYTDKLREKYKGGITDGAETKKEKR